MSPDTSQSPIVVSVQKGIAAHPASRRSPLFRLVLIMLIALFSRESAGAYTPIPGDRRIIHEFWTFKDGAPEIPLAFAQTADGYLWVGAPTGLYRFDGMRFELFRSPFGDQLQSTGVSGLFAPPSGGLWIGYRLSGGFSFIKNGTVTNFVENTGTVKGFAQDRNGIVWAASIASSGGLWRFNGSSWQHIGAEWNAPEKPIAQMGFDREGILWVLAGSRVATVPKQLFYLMPGESKFRKAGDNLSVPGFTWNADHTVLTIHERRPGEPGSGIELDSSLPAYPILKKNSVQILDRAKSIWLLSLDHPIVLRHAAGEPLAEIVSNASPTNSDVYNINSSDLSSLVDREGGIWFGDEKGVHRFSYSPLIEQELPKWPGPYFSLAPDEGGAVWISAGDAAGSSNLYRVTEGKAKLQRSLGGVSNFAYRAPDKTFWFGGEGGLWHMVHGSLTRIELPPEMVQWAANLICITQDRSGRMWVSFGSPGLYRLENGVWTKNGGRRDLPNAGVVIEFTDSLGRVWFGCTKNQLAVLDGDRVQTFGQSDGVQVGNITSIYGRGSEIWIGGEFGLQHFDHGRFHTIHSVDKESLRGISGIVETANGDLWLNGLGGIVHVRRAEILEALKNPAYQISGERFDRRAGLPGLPSQLRQMPTAVEGTDGRLWFTVNNGVVWLDPARASNKIPPPPVTIQSVAADDRGYELSQQMRFPARTSNVQISYAAVSLLNPEAIRFRYKLLETDKDWHEAGTSAFVSYRNLPPGSYHFLVAASDTNGIWSDNTAIAEFTLLPAFYQTNWFRVLGAVILLALFGAAYQFRVRQLRRDFKKLHEVIESIPAMAWTALPDGSNEFVNRRWVEYTGLSADETAGSGWMAAVHPEDLQRYGEKWRASITNGEPFELEARFRSAANGEYRWLLARGVPLRDEHGNILRWYGVLTDVEDRKRTEENLRQSEAYLAEAQKLSHCGSWALDLASDRYCYVSEEDLRVFGFDPREGLPTREAVFQRIHPDDRDRVRESFEKALREKVDSSDEYRIVLPDGTVKHIYTIRHPVLNSEEEVFKLVGTSADITERKRAEETLRESERRFRVLVDHVADAILVQDDQGIIVDVNRQGCETLGYTRQEVVGKAPSESFCLKEDGDERISEMEPAGTAALESMFDRHWHRRKDGTVFPVEVHTSTFWHDGRRFLLKAVRDISESLRAEEAIRQSEKQLREVIDTIPAYVWSAMPDGSVDFINRRVLEFSGFSLEQAIGQGWQAAIHPEDRDHYLAVEGAAIASGEAFDVEARLRKADGQYRWLLFRSVPMRDETGKVVKRYGVSTDIDDRKRAEQALRRSEAYLADAQRLTHTGAWASDETTRPLYWSEEVFRIFGFDPQQGLPTLEQRLQRIHPEDLDKFWNGFQRTIREKVDSEDEFRIVLPDGTTKHAYALAHPVLDAKGEFVEAVGTIIDVTELKRAEQERERLRQLEAELAHINRVSIMGELAASIAHEVNQPLSGVVSYGGACLRWLAANPPNMEEAREAARRIIGAGKRAAEVIARIRALTKRAAAPREKLDLNQTILEVLALVGDQAKKNSVMIRTRFADNLSPVLGDRVQLQQVVLNLIMNGIEAMNSVGGARELVITTLNIDAGYVQATVQDSGIGIDSNTITRIFDSFYTTKPGGMGMGLSISRSILQSHEGRLWATANDSPGTTFHFTLPKYHEEASNAGA